METTQQLLETTQQLRPQIRETDNNALILRLERNQMEVMQLRGKLRSYLCEPKTYGLFQRMENIRNAMDNFNRTNREIIQALRGHKRTVEDYTDRAKKQFKEFKRLNAIVEEYLLNCMSGELQT